MALQSIVGEGLCIPNNLPAWGNTPALGSALTIDATGEMAAFCGQVHFAARTGTKDIRKVHFRFGSVTKAGGSGLTVSLQNVNNSATNLLIPDETQDQTVAIANGDAGFTSNVWYTTGNLSADRTVTYGDYLAVVVEYDGSGRLGADSVVISVLNHALGANQNGNTALKTGGSWAAGNHAGGPILEFSDGSFGWFHGLYPCSAVSTHAFKQDTGTADEYALKFQNPFTCKVDGGWVIANIGGSTAADFDVILYDGTSAMTNGTVSFLAERLVSGARLLEVCFPEEITLDKNHDYYLAVKPTQTTANVTITSFDVNAAGHLVAWPGGANYHLATRLDLGSWSATTTRRPNFGIRISSLDDGAGSGGGGHISSGFFPGGNVTF